MSDSISYQLSVSSYPLLVEDKGMGIGVLIQLMLSVFFYRILHKILQLFISAAFTING